MLLHLYEISGTGKLTEAQNRIQAYQGFRTEQRTGGDEKDLDTQKSRLLHVRYILRPRVNG